MCFISPSLLLTEIFTNKFKSSKHCNGFVAHHILDHNFTHIPSIYTLFHQIWLRIEQDMTKYIFIRQNLNMLLFYLFLSQILTNLGDLRLILKGNFRKNESPVQFRQDQSKPVLKPIKTDCNRFF